MMSQALEARDWPVAHDLIDPPPVSSASVASAASAASAASSSPSGGAQVQTVQTGRPGRPGEALLHEAIQEVDWATRWPLGAGALAEAEVLSARMLLDNAVVVDALREVRTTGVRRCTHVCEDVCERVLYACAPYARVLRRCTEVYERVRTCANVSWWARRLRRVECVTSGTSVTLDERLSERPRSLLRLCLWVSASHGAYGFPWLLPMVSASHGFFPMVGAPLWCKR